jgi:hypothetical protein
VHLPALRPPSNWIRKIQTNLVLSYWKRISRKSTQNKTR